VMREGGLGRDVHARPTRRSRDDARPHILTSPIPTSQARRRGSCAIADLNIPPQSTLPTPNPPRPQALSPQALSPQALSPQALSPQALSPQALSPQALSPQALSPLYDYRRTGDQSRGHHPNAPPLLSPRAEARADDAPSRRISAGRSSREATETSGGDRSPRHRPHAPPPSPRRAPRREAPWRRSTPHGHVAPRPCARRRLTPLA
jgi:hypothetical protein